MLWRPGHGKLAAWYCELLVSRSWLALQIARVAPPKCKVTGGLLGKLPCDTACILLCPIVESPIENCCAAKTTANSVYQLPYVRLACSQGIVVSGMQNWLAETTGESGCHARDWDEADLRRRHIVVSGMQNHPVESHRVTQHEDHCGLQHCIRSIVESGSRATVGGGCTLRLNSGLGRNPSSCAAFLH